MRLEKLDRLILMEELGRFREGGDIWFRQGFNSDGDKRCFVIGD